MFRFLFLALPLSLLGAVPVYSQDCTARILQGRSPYPHLKSGQRIKFWSYTVGTLGAYPQYGVVKSFIGDRMLTIPVRDLYDISPDCSQLKEYRERY